MVLLTGGSGFVGKRVLERLLATGYSVRVLSRRKPKLPADLPAGRVEFFDGDVTASDSVAHAAAGASAVIHLVGIIRETGTQTFRQVHVEGTRSVVAAAKLAGVSRFIHMSALGTRESAPSTYHRSKWEAEQIVMGSGLDYTIFRPSLIYGRGDGFLRLFGAMMRPPMSSLMLGCVPCPGGFEGSKFQPVAVGDAAKIFVRALSAAGSIGKIYDLCCPEKLTMWQMLSALAAAEQVQPTVLRCGMDTLPFQLAWHILFSEKPIFFNMPIYAMRAAAFAAEKMGVPVPLNRDTVQMLSEGSEGDCTPATRDFGVEFTPFAEGVHELYQR